jgi:hypothetical protein
MTGKGDVPSIRTFRSNLQSVHELMRFDDMVLEFIIGPMQRIADRQTTGGIVNARHRVDQLLGMIKGIKQNESLRRHYAAMYNQCLVLLVSYFASATRSLFIEAVVASIDSGARDELLDVEVRLTPRDVREGSGPTSQILAEAIADAKEMSFQDMQSVDRAFRRYFGVAPEKGQMVNDIIVGQACRHAIVHAGAQVNRRLINQIRSAVPRTIKPLFEEGTAIEFERSDLRAVMKEMLKYLRDTASLIENTGIALSRQADT